ncbi:MAG: hypothetical protein Q9225_007760 [Loekoesia sp. 1 TL-2023]
MHFSSTYLTLALATATTTLASPAKGPVNTANDGQYTQPTGNLPSQPTGNNLPTQPSGTSNLPAQCSMFKHYVPEIVLDAVCSLHMNPGAMPTLNSACFGGAQPTVLPQPQNTYGQQQNTYGQQQPAATTEGLGTEPTTRGGNDESGFMTLPANSAQATASSGDNGGFTAQATGNPSQPTANTY